MEILKSINWLDIIVVLLLIRGVYLGVRNGLTAELFRFIGTVLTLTLAVQWYSQVADILIANLTLPAWLSQFLCFVAIAQLVRVIFKYGLTLILKILNIQFIPQLEKVGGGVTGLGRGVLVAGISILVLSFFPSAYITESIYDKSYSGIFLVKAMERTYKSVTFWLPEDKTEKAIFSRPAPPPKMIKLKKQK